METKNIKAFGTNAADAPLHEMNIKRRKIQSHDVEIEITYCGSVIQIYTRRKTIGAERNIRWFPVTK